MEIITGRQDQVELVVVVEVAQRAGARRLRARLLRSRPHATPSTAKTERRQSSREGVSFPEGTATREGALDPDALSEARTKKTVERPPSSIRRPEATIYDDARGMVALEDRRTGPHPI